MKRIITVLVFITCLFSVKQGNAQTGFHIYPHGVDTICHGDSLLVEAVSGFAHYYWTGGKTSRIIYIKTPGKYICIGIDGSGNHYKDSIQVYMYPIKTLQITSNPHPAVVCSGARLVLEATPGFASYHWSDGSNHRERELFPTTSTTLSVEAIDSNGCVRRESIAITVNNCDSCKVIFTNRTVLCGYHDSILLEAKYGFKYYYWNTGSHNRLLWVKTPGWYKIIVADSSLKHCSDSIHITFSAPVVNIYSNPNPAKVCKNALLVVEASNGFTTYNWSNGMSGNRLELHPQHSGLLILEAVNAHGCVAKDTIHIIVDTCTSGTGFDLVPELNYFPNPVNGSELFISSSIPVDQVCIYSVSGDLVLSKTIQNEKSLKVDCSSVNDGFYILLIKSGNTTYRKHLIINRL